MHATGTIPEAAARLAWALRVLDGPHILDAGCGEGSLTIGLARAGHEVSGADHRPEAVEAARAALGREEAPVQQRTHFLVVGGPLPFADASFDSVMLGDADASASALEEVRRVTVAAGRVAVWLPGDLRPGALDRLAGMFQLEGFEIVDGGIGLEMLSTSPLPGTDQPLARAVEDAARLLRPAPGAGDHGQPAEIRALLVSSRADRARVEALEAELEHRKDELGRLRSRHAELERRERELGAAHRDLEAAAASEGRRAEALAARLAEVEAELEQAQAHAGRADSETREAQALARAQEHRLAEAEAAAVGLRSQLAQSAEDARRRLETRATMQVHLDHARKEAQRLRSELNKARGSEGDQGPHEAELAVPQASVEVVPDDAGPAGAQVEALRATVARQQRALTEIKHSKGQRFIRHFWLLRKRRRVVGAKAAAAVLALIACVVSLVLGWLLAAGLLAVVAVLAGGVLGLELAGPFAPRALRRRRRSGSS